MTLHNKRNHDDEKGVFFTNRHLGWIVSVVILSSFFVFMAGYFLGQKKGVEKFATKMEQDSLADQIYSSLCTLYDVGDELTENSGDSSVVEAAETNEQIALVEKNEASIASAQPQVAEVLKDENVGEPSGACYYAQLLGCGSAKTAEQFVKRWLARGVELDVQKRQSRSAQGKIRYWYQVVSGRYNKKEDLDVLVQRISSQEKLQDVRIVTC